MTTTDKNNQTINGNVNANENGNGNDIRCIMPYQDAERRPAVPHWCDELGDLSTFFDDCGCDEIRVADVLVALIDASLATLGLGDCGKTDIESHDAMTFLLNVKERILTLKAVTLDEYADVYGDRRALIGGGGGCYDGNDTADDRDGQVAAGV